MHRALITVIAAVVLLAGLYGLWNGMWLSAGVGAFSEDFANAHAGAAVTADELRAYVEAYIARPAGGMLAVSVVLLICGVLLLVVGCRGRRSA